MTATMTDRGTGAYPAAERPYAPSWLDHFTSWLDLRLGATWWLFYLGLAVVLNVVHAAIKWWDGSYPPATFYPFHVAGIASIVYAFALMHYLDRAAVEAVVQFRPLMEPGGMQMESLHYRLTTLPAHVVRLLTIVAVPYGLLSAAASRGLTFQFAPLLFTSPLASAFESLLIVCLQLGAFLFVYHTIHQLRVVGQVYASIETVDLFNLDPLYAFSRFTARTAIGLIVLIYLWALVGPTPLGDRLSLANTASLLLLALATFALPLLGIHRLLVEAKTRAMAGVGQRLNAATAELHRQIDGTSFDSAAPLAPVVTALKEERELVERIPTWPWQPGTAWQVITALLFPALLGLLTRLLEHAINSP